MVNVTFLCIRIIYNIMAELFPAFAKNILSLLPRYEPILNRMKKNNSLLLNYPLSLAKSASSRLCFISESRIPKGMDIYL